VSERGATTSLTDAVGCGMISATFQFGPAPFGCSRLIVTSWISLAAEGPPSNFQAFRLKPSPAFGSLLLQFSFFLPHGRRAGKLGSVTSSHAPERRLNARFTSKRHALHL
jgi:hypothetical protein